MSTPYVIYGNYVNEEVYRRAMARVSLSDRMRKYKLLITSNIFLRSVYIEELAPEQDVNKADGVGECHSATE